MPKSLRVRRRRSLEAIAAVVRQAASEPSPVSFAAAFAPAALTARESVELAQVSSRSIERLSQHVAGASAVRLAPRPGVAEIYIATSTSTRSSLFGRSDKFDE
jgi:hypothetical protein